MVMEYVSGGELFDYICKHGRVSASPESAQTLVWEEDGGVQEQNDCSRERS